ncbi:hypothetical protein CSIV_04810 [Microbacterium sp. CSI-V]|uniref:serine/threonine-protein kinase n=1 Tax=unclassified Microbacterium TaxID=2609290 RepID=UPI00097CA1F0|nr:MULTISPECIES: serine/threonine-protein kinase [unclassified Microbacterium]MXS74824.1 serine/threonine protein kinase [Microbacterium sp. TL13]ONI65603.1 hypothetical protein CSIV_04810 [Microbacterium sp. CSI-V]
MTDTDTTQPADPAAADLFDGRYRLGRVLGTGGYARVYEAVDTSLGRTVALKVMIGDGADPADAARVRSEIRLLASLSHPSLVTLYDARLSSTPTYLAMELIAGPTLTDVIERGPVPPADAARYGREIAEALAVVHSRGIVHRDVKPSNVLLRPPAHTGERTRATLADFGIAALVGATRVTRADTVIGTAAYLSPEQARGMPAAPASDVYSLGLVLLEALTGRRPFGGRTPHEALAARLVSPPDIPDDVPAPWRALLSRMTAIDPAERPDAAALGAELRALPGESVPLTPLGATALIDGPAPEELTRTRVLPPVAAPPRRGGRRRTVVVVAVIAAVLAVGGAAAAIGVNASAPASDPSLPSLPAPLDQHVDDLWKEVGP